MKLINRRLIGATAAGGTATIVDPAGAVFGKLYAVEWVDGTLVDGVDAVLTVTNRESAVNKTLLTLTDANNDAFYYPRDLVHDATGTALTGTAGGDRTLPLVDGVLSLAIADGGATKTGGCIVYLEVYS